MRLGLITRCRDEYFVEEFARYYLNQGVDVIYIIDDDSSDQSIYEGLKTLDRVKIIHEKNMTKNGTANQLYHEIRFHFDWIIYVDIDEFIVTKKQPSHTIRDELETTFANADCVKIPWVMMSCNSLKESPESVLLTNTYRWNHNLRHENKQCGHRKFRCRYDKIEVKSIFKPHCFEDLWLHHPKNPVMTDNLLVVDSIDNKRSVLNPFYPDLREDHIVRGHLLCYHYRIISINNCKRKIATSRWYQDYGLSVDDILSTDYAEIIDTTLARRSVSLGLSESTAG